MTAVCREGHASDEPDYCSVCGAPVISGAAAPKVPVPAASYAKSRAFAPPSAVNCPSCGEPREDPDARFCEVCRYDFQEKRPGPPPIARAAAAPAAAPAAAAAPVPAAAPRRWELVIIVDPTLDTDPDPAHPCPINQAEIVLPVDKPEMLVGRHDETRAIHPEVPLHDPGASRRHAKFVVDPDGGVSLQDLASTNGTQVNARDVPPGTKQRLHEGDAVTLGRWTRIALRGRP
jgi:hypothetical protein